jgi:MurNAc alpha-1-phosphate uridylyltransferase
VITPRALLFAAGRGERMRPLTDAMPKPLLEAGGETLIGRHLRRLAALGVCEVVINTSWLGEAFPRALGDGAAYGLRIVYSYEGATPLETGGGMLAALPLLGDAPFLLVNGDVWCDYDFARLPRAPRRLAHLVMVDTAAHAPQGDFALGDDGRLHLDGAQKLTYAGIGVYSPRLLDRWRDAVGASDGVDARPPRFPLAPLLRAAIARGEVHGEHHRGAWTDVGTPQRLEELRARLR